MQACGFGRTLKDQKAFLDARSIREADIRHVVLDDCVVLGGQILTKKQHFWLSTDPTLTEGLALESFSEAEMPNSMHGLRYFGHWLRDDCATYELLDHGTTRVLLGLPDWPDRRVYEHAFGQRWTGTGPFHARKLSLYRDIGNNLHKAQRHRVLRERLRRRWPRGLRGRSSS